jgi:carboxylesterase type B
MKPRRSIVLSLCLALVVPATMLALTSRAAAGAATAAKAPVVHTDKGAIQGVAAAGVDSYLGVRYAKAPVGPLRWERPQPATAWRGVMPTTAYGNRCPQSPSTNGPLSLTEDCLSVNVQRPSGTPGPGGLPVYVFFHGRRPDQRQL